MAKQDGGMFAGDLDGVFAKAWERAVKEGYKEAEQKGKLQEFDEALGRLYEKLPDVMEEVVEDLGENIASDLSKERKSLKRYRNKQARSMQRAVRRRWGEAITRLEMLLQGCLESGFAFNSYHRPRASAENDLVFEVLIRLQARACAVCGEIVTMLKNGHAGGADARWRTLHEIVVVGFFVEEHGDEVANRYLVHDVVESWRAARQYRQYSEILGYEEIDDSELKELEEDVKTSCKQFGENFRNRYGWAAEALGRKDPGFADIEEAVGLDYLRPFYKMASHSVHAQPKGVYFQPGLYPENREMMLAGPSVFGLADTGQNTSISLAAISRLMLVYKPSIESLVIADTIRRLASEAQEAFMQAHRRLEDAEKRRKSRPTRVWSVNR